MASSKDRQRKLERARAERRLARQAERARRKRQVQAGIGASLALILIVLGVTWLLGGFDSKPAGPEVAAGQCTWTLKDPSADTNVIDTGHPDPDGAPRTGIRTMTIKTNLGDIEAKIDASKAPCAAASFAYLGAKDYFKDSTCFRLSTPLKTLQCGDPNNDGTGTPAYQFADEDRPSTVAEPDPSASPEATPTTKAGPYYSKGQIIMVNTGLNTNGSQFYIVYGDGSPLPAAYSIVGQITKGLDIVEKVAGAGALNDSGSPVEEGKPKTDLTIQSLTVSDAVTPTPSASVSPSNSATPKAS